jgi:serine/threonine-protein kinase
MATTVSISTGQMLGKYQVTGHIANGAMGMVYRARDTKLNRDVALKVLYPHLTNDLGLMRRFQREAQTIAQLNHPNIVSLYDTDESDGYHYIAMQLIDGPSLGARLRQPGVKSMSSNDALEIAKQIGSALDYAHSRGLVHRDVKPDNILCSSDGRYFLTDFSIVQLANATHLTQAFASLGTPAYMSPEQGQGSKTIDQRSDIYSFGVVLYELLAGIPPFEASTPIGVVMKHINEPPPPLARARPDLPPPIRKLVERALAKKPTDRYQRASELVSAAQQIQQGVPQREGGSTLRVVVAGVSALVLAGAGVLTMSALRAAGTSNSGATATRAPETTALSVIPTAAAEATPTRAVAAPPTVTALPQPTVAPVIQQQETTVTPLATSTEAPIETATPPPTETALPTATPVPTSAGAATRRIVTPRPRRTLAPRPTATPLVRVVVPTSYVQQPPPAPTQAPPPGGGDSGGGGNPQPPPAATQAPPPPPQPTSPPAPPTAAPPPKEPTAAPPPP